MNEYTITYKDGNGYNDSVVITAVDVKEAKKEFKSTFPQYTITSIVFLEKSQLDIIDYA